MNEEKSAGEGQCDNLTAASSDDSGCNGVEDNKPLTPVAEQEERQASPAQSEGQGEVPMIKRPGKTLLRNWAEERSCYELGFGDEHKKTVRQLNKSGHRAILQQNEKDHLVRPTMQSDFTWPEKMAPALGPRDRMFQEELYKQVQREMEEEREREKFKNEYSTETKTSFVPRMDTRPTALQHLETEGGYSFEEVSDKPCTVWIQNIDAGKRTRIVDNEEPHKRNSLFSMPIAEYKFAPQKNE
eukprot:Nk52_evm126s221 gene=Nk52_evmTU126s221